MNETRLPRVVLADDEQHIRMLIKRILMSVRYEVVGEATNGNEAIDLFNKEKPDMLLLDINMPFKNGDAVLQEVISKYPEAVVIMLTSVSDLESVKRCLDHGAANFIRKDTPLNEIKSIITQTWESHIESRISGNA
ncbi:MAG: response regulator transcription factor [Nitrospirota bacterium]